MFRTGPPIYWKCSWNKDFKFKLKWGFSISKVWTKFFLSKIRLQGELSPYLCRNWDMYYIAWFKHLKYLPHFNFSHNGLLFIPLMAFENLPRCSSKVYLNNNWVHTLIWKKKKKSSCFKSMKVLDLSQNWLQMTVQLKTAIQLHTAASHSGSGT